MLWYQREKSLRRMPFRVKKQSIRKHLGGVRSQKSVVVWWMWEEGVAEMKMESRP